MNRRRSSSPPSDDGAAFFERCEGEPIQMFLMCSMVFEFGDFGVSLISLGD